MTYKPTVSVEDFPWYQPGEPENIEQHAFNSGLVSARTRFMLDDPNVEEIVNWGMGPNDPNREINVEALKPREDVGLFGIFTSVAVEDRDFFRHLLPDLFGMPTKPILSLAIIDYNQRNPAIRSRESMVLLNGIAKNGVEVWYVLDMPVDPWIPLALGHDWGFRKSLHNLTIERHRTSAHTKDGDLVMTLDLTPGEWPDGHHELVPQTQGAGIMDMATVDPKNTDTVLRWFATGGLTPLDEEKGSVSINVSPRVEWFDLLGSVDSAPGYYMRGFPGGDLRIQKIR